METTVPGIANEQLLRRVRGEYLEMPGLRLTRRQAQRLWAMDESTCNGILDSLTALGFLRRQDDGTYARVTDGPVVFPPARMARAEPAGASRRLARVG